MFPDIHSYAQWREVRHKIDLVRVARELLGEPKNRSGDRSYWSCPFHGDETTSSFQVTEGKSLWKCLECDRWGDAVDLVRRGKGVTFSGALAFLSRREFYPDGGEVRPESPAPGGPTREVVPDGATVVDNQWMDNFIREAFSSPPEQ